MKIKFIKEVKLGPGKGSFVLEREMSLPFIPVRGVRVLDSDVGFQAVVDHVTYHVTKGLFECITEPEMEIYYAKINGLDHRTAREIIDGYEAHGWRER